MFSSHLKELHRENDFSFNVDWFKRYLFYGYHIDSETPFKSVYQISGGYGLRIKGNKVVLNKSWNIDKEERLSFEEASKMLRNELTISVTKRIENKRVVGDLSGGLDSSTIAILSSKKKPIDVFTIVGKEEDEDVKIAKSIAKSSPNIRQHIFTQEDLPSIYSGIDNIKTDIPIPSM